MAAYDSDSSGDLDDYTETTTLLGYASKDRTDDVFSQLGGLPTWLDGKTSPSATLGRCKVCNDHLNLLLQLNGDLPEKFPGHERCLYLFGCRRKTCRRKEGSVRGVRASRISKHAKVASSPPAALVEEKKVPAPNKNLGNQLFGGTSTAGVQSGGNPFSSNPFSGSSGPPNPFASASSLAAKPAQKVDAASLPETFTSKAKITDSQTPSDSSFKAPKAPEPHEPWPAAESLPPPYPKYYLDADYETLDKPKVPETSRVTGTLEDAEMGGTSSAGGAEDKQLFESSMDKTFQKFADRLAQNSEQVLRYEFDGQPLLYSSTDAVGKRLAPEHTAAAVSSKIGTAKQGSGIPRCTTCGGERVFELQLTPHAITELEADEMSLEGMDWGAIILGVCTRDCVPAGTADEAVGYVEEWVGVQWEELAK